MRRKLVNNDFSGRSKRQFKMRYHDKLHDLGPRYFQEDDEWIEQFTGPQQEYKRRRRRSVFDKRHDFYTYQKRQPVSQDLIVLHSNIGINFKEQKEGNRKLSMLDNESLEYENGESEMTDETLSSESSAQSHDSDILGLNLLDTQDLNKFSSEAEEEEDKLK